MGASCVKSSIHPEQICYEDVLSWKNSFEKLMNTKVGQKFFHDFLKTEYSTENLDFWRKCEEYKTIMDQGKKKDKATEIFMKFLLNESKTQISVDGKTKDDIGKAIDDSKNISGSKLSNELFDKAQADIYILMSRDSYSRFITSDFLKDKLESFGVAETNASNPPEVSEQPN